MVFLDEQSIFVLKDNVKFFFARVGQPMTLEEIETQAAELSIFYKRFIIKLKLCIKLIRFYIKSKSEYRAYRTNRYYSRSIER
jgi:hypothetical protein